MAPEKIHLLCFGFSFPLAGSLPVMIGGATREHLAFGVFFETFLQSIFLRKTFISYYAFSMVRGSEN
jgi:hypothetical protein